MSGSYVDLYLKLKQELGLMTREDFKVSVRELRNVNMIIHYEESKIVYELFRIPDQTKRSLFLFERQ